MLHETPHELRLKIEAEIAEMENAILEKRALLPGIKYLEEQCASNGNVIGKEKENIDAKSANIGKPRLRLGASTHAILQCLYDRSKITPPVSPEMSFDEIQKGTNQDRLHVRSAARNLIERGFAERTREGVVAITKEGMEFLQEYNNKKKPFNHGGGTLAWSQ